jgi:hypothetical protein
MAGTEALGQGRQEQLLVVVAPEVAVAVVSC